MFVHLLICSCSFQPNETTFSCRNSCGACVQDISPPEVGKDSPAEFKCAQTSQEALSVIQHLKMRRNLIRDSVGTSGSVPPAALMFKSNEPTSRVQSGHTQTHIHTHGGVCLPFDEQLLNQLFIVERLTFNKSSLKRSQQCYSGSVITYFFLITP